jgi:ligand-binding SRPBCC domain-containing protein
MNVRVQLAETEIPAPVEEVFDFFSRPENLEILTPDFVRFKILTPLPIEMTAGTFIDYRIRIVGVPVRWRTEITVWEPLRRFVDVQVSGPYRLWEHEHRFESRGDRTVMFDRVRFASPGWFLEPIIHRLFVGPRVDQIFRYRAEAILRQFPGSNAQ